MVCRRDPPPSALLKEACSCSAGLQSWALQLCQVGIKGVRFAIVCKIAGGLGRVHRR